MLSFHMTSPFTFLLREALRLREDTRLGLVGRERDIVSISSINMVCVGGDIGEEEK